MTESEYGTLYADDFTPADQPFLAGLQCGDESWSMAATEWITSSEVYANQIMEHLIGQAREIALQIMRSKPPSKHVDLLTLKVHRQNVAAKKLYDRFGFELLDGFEDDEHLMMFHKLDLEEQDITDE